MFKNRTYIRTSLKVDLFIYANLPISIPIYMDNLFKDLLKSTKMVENVFEKKNAKMTICFKSLRHKERAIHILTKQKGGYSCIF